MLFFVASSPTDCAEGNAQKVTARFDSSSAETVTEVVEEKSDIFLGKRISQSGSKDIVPDVVDTSDPVQTMFSDNGSELCWAMSSELQKFTVGIETQLVEEIPGTGQHLTSWESTFTKAILEHIMWIEGGKCRRIFL